MLADEPQDAFLRYSLAMEVSKVGEHERAQELYQGLMQDQPPYIPAFLMAAQLFVQLDEIESARGVLRTGIEAAREQGEAHAAGEMADLLASLGSYGD